MPIGPAGQSAVTAQVGMQIMPIGELLQVQPRAPAGHAPVQSAVVVHARGPIMPASPIGIIMPAAKDASGVAWKHRGMYGQVLVST